MANSDAAEQYVLRTPDRPPDIKIQVADLYKDFNADLYRRSDTASAILPSVQICDVPSPSGMKSPHGRNFTFQNDGYPHYRVSERDSRGLYDITSDYLTTKNHGRKPSPQEVRDFAQRIAEANGIKNINNIRVGTDLRIPDRVQPPQSLPDVRIERKVEVGQTRAGEKPSLDFEKATTLDIYRRNERNHPNSDGTITRKFDGAVRDGILGLDRTQVDGFDRVDKNGKLIETEVNMSPAKTFKVPKIGGGEDSVEARQIRVKYNADGTYSTELTLINGDKVNFKTYPDGRKERRY